MRSARVRWRLASRFSTVAGERGSFALSLAGGGTVNAEAVVLAIGLDLLRHLVGHGGIAFSRDQLLSEVSNPIVAFAPFRNVAWTTP